MGERGATFSGFARSFSKGAGQWLLGGGALLTIVGFATNVQMERDQREAQLRITICQSAREILTDDKPNEALEPVQVKAMIDWALRTLQQCDMKQV